MATKINKNKVIAAAQKCDQKRQYDKAIKEYSKIVEEDPRDVRIWLKIGDLYAKKNAPDEAIETYSKVAEFYSEQGFYLKAVAVYKQILKLNANLVEMNLRLAELYKQLGLLSDSMRQYEQVSNFYHREGRTKEALAALRQIVDLDPENVASRIKLAELYSKENMRVEAVEEFSKAGDYLRAENRLDDFVKVGERLIYHQPDNLPLTKELAGIYLRKRDPRRALQKLQLAFKADPRDEETLEMLAQAFEDLSQVQKTISVLKELARIQKENGQDKKRIATYERIVSLYPQDPEACKVLAEAGPQARHYEPNLSSDMNAGYPPAQPPASAEPASPQGLNPPAYGYNSPGYDGYYHQESSSYADSDSQYSYEDPYDRKGAAHLPQQEAAPAAPAATLTKSAAPAQLSTSAAAAPSFDEIAKIITEADVYIKYGLHDKATEHLRQVFSRDPYNTKVHLKLKDLYLQLARYREAAEEMIFLGKASLEADPQLAADLLQQALDLDPDNNQAYELLTHLAGGAPPPVMPYSDDSISEVEPIDLDSDDIVEEIPIDSDDIVVSEPPFGDGQGPMRAPADALELPAEYGDSFQEDYPTSGFRPRHPLGPSGVLELHGTSTDTLGGGVPSSEVIQLGVEPSPSPAQLRAHQEEEASGIEDDLEEAEFFIQQNLFSEARSILRDLLEQHPHNQLVAAKLADMEALEQRPQVEPAEDTRHDELTTDLARELAADFDDLDAVELLPEVDATYSVQDVFKEFKRGVNNQISDEDSDTHYDLGIAYREMGLMDDAVTEFKIAMRSREKEVLCHMMIGLCYMEKELFSEAISQFKTGLYVEGISDRETIALYFELGQAYEQLDDLREALYYYEKVAKKDARFRDVSSRVIRLRKLTGEDEPGLGGDPGDSPDMLNKVV